jgi:hypothetical protein
MKKRRRLKERKNAETKTNADATGADAALTVGIKKRCCFIICLI